MGMGTLGGGNGKKRYRPMAEINVTPLVDVMLVLLIIFMVTAPMITSSVNVNLPQAKAQATPNPTKPITISVDAQGNIYLQNNQVALANLGATLTQASQNNPATPILVRGDKDVNYGLMMQVMATIVSGGFTKVDLLTKPGS